MHKQNSQPAAEGRWRKLVGDIGVYAVGNLGAKVLTFLMVPLYTYFIPDAAEFGYFDICLTAAFLLTPVVTLDLREGVFRYLLDAPHDEARRRVVTATGQLLARALAVALVIALAAGSLLAVRHLWLVLLLLLGVVVNEVYGQMVRGLGRNKLFAGMGLATAALIVLLSVVLVAWLDMGVAGIFLANAAARLLPAAVVELWQRPASRLFSRATPWRQSARELLRYSLPLLPAALIWWVLSFGDRWFVLWAAGAEANGVYAVAARFTGVVYTFSIILQQAWQETAILQYASDDRDRFFSLIFGAFISATCMIVTAYLAVMRLCYGWLVEAHYAASQAYLFPMAVAMAVLAVANFLELGYQCSRNTVRALLSSLLTGVLNVALNLVLAPRWGVWGVIAASMVAFAFFAAYRYVDTRRYFVLTPGWRTLVPVALMLATGALGYTPLPAWAQVLAALGAIAIGLLVLPAELHNKLRLSSLF